MTLPFDATLSEVTASINAPIWGIDDLGDAYSLIEAQRRRIQELEQLATKDELTGLSNRRGLNAAITLEQERIARGQSQGAMLVMIDLNGFKDINDTFGHEAGDSALRAVAATLLSFIRTTDHAARLGGDEFVLFLTHTTASQMVSRLQLLDHCLGSLTLDWKGRILTLSAAIGTATMSAGTTSAHLFDTADGAMYAAKSAHKRTEKRTKTTISRQRFVPPSPSSTPTSSERITA